MENNKKLSYLRKQINNLIYEKHLNKYEQNKLNYFIEEYKKLDNDRTPFVYIALAKHYLSIGNIKLAKENIRKAESINSDLPSISYLNYRINVRLGNNKIAYEYLKQYEEKLKENHSNKVDLSIYYYLFSKLLNNKESTNFDNQEYINTVKINDLNFKKIWYDFRKSIFSEKYSDSKGLISKLNQYCKLNNILLNFDEIDILIDKIILSKNKVKKPTLDEEINCIKKLIDEDILDLAEEKLNGIKQFLNYKSKKIHIELLKRYLNEKKEINELKKSNLYDVYIKFKNDGKINYYHDDYYTAYQYFTAGYYLTGINDFNFHAARCLHFMGEDKKAAILNLEYIKKGYDKLLRCYHHLSINKYFTVKQQRYFYQKYNQLSKILNENSYSDNLNKNSKSLLVELSEFMNEDEENVNINTVLNNFENYNNTDKLRYIKYLYQKSHKNIADRLLKKYEHQIIEDKDARGKALQLRKNRTLYINQGKHANNN